MGKNAESGCLPVIEVGDYTYVVTGADCQQQLPYTICEKEWGRIELVSMSPHIACMVLYENQTDKNIDYVLTFGAAYRISTVLLIQLRNHKQHQ